MNSNQTPSRTPSEGSRPLSPSRASDFKRCPQLFKFKSIDKIREPPTQATIRGTIVHKILEDLFERNASERVEAAARDLITPTIKAYEGEFERLPEVTSGGPGVAAVVRDEIEAEVRRAVDNYFNLEDPTRVDVAARELRITGNVGQVEMVGIIDRVDRLPGGNYALADYKTGKAPRAEFSKEAFFALRIYAILAAQDDRVTAPPTRLRLLYLGSTESLELDLEPRHRRGTEQQIEAIATAIESSTGKGDFRPATSRLCDWCYFKPICPAFGGSGLADDLPGASPK